jgi:1-acyl-sn-glycerol-3-phosphate acyltransferase
MWTLPFLCIALLLLTLGWRRSGQKLHDYLGHGLVYVYVRVWQGCRHSGPAPLPKCGPAILYTNHTCSADPAFLDAGCVRPLSFILAEEYYNITWLRWLFDYLGCVTAKRDGRDVTAARQALRRLEQGRVLCLFPEGGLSNAGRQRLRPGKVGLAWLALRSGAPVFPGLIVGGPQTGDLLPAWLSPFGRARVIFGPAVDLSAFRDRPLSRKVLEEVTALCMHKLVELRGRKPPPVLSPTGGGRAGRGGKDNSDGPNSGNGIDQQALHALRRRRSASQS